MHKQPGRRASSAAVARSIATGVPGGSGAEVDTGEFERHNMNERSFVYVEVP